MDCPSEEQLVRMALSKSSLVEDMRFDLSARSLTVTHRGNGEAILDLLAPLNYGANILASSKATAESIEPTADNAGESRVLKQLFNLNLAMFFAEIGGGIYSQSAGLIADGLDMFADASVYGISLLAVGRPYLYKQRAARLSGYLQLAMAIGLFVEVMRRFFVGSDPIGTVISSIAAVALFVNVLCLILLMKHRNGEVHMQASWIFSANDVLANVGVILAGALVAWTGSNYPDLIIGTVISALVLRGALQILRLSRN